MTFEPRRNELSVSDLHLAGRQIIVIASLGCKFSTNAMDAIAKDPELRDTFASRSKWIVPPEGQLTLSRLSDWNDANPKFSLALVYDGLEFPWVTRWRTPLFLFLVDGEVVGEVVGWPEGGNSAALLKQAAKLDAGHVHAIE